MTPPPHVYIYMRKMRASTSAFYICRQLITGTTLLNNEYSLITSIPIVIPPWPCIFIQSDSRLTFLTKRVEVIVVYYVTIRQELTRFLILPYADLIHHYNR